LISINIFSAAIFSSVWVEAFAAPLGVFDYVGLDYGCGFILHQLIFKILDSSDQITEVLMEFLSVFPRIGVIYGSFS